MNTNRHELWVHIYPESESPRTFDKLNPGFFLSCPFVSTRGCSTSEQFGWILFGGKQFAALEKLHRLAPAPLPQPIKRREHKLRRRAALSADQLRAAAHIIHQPRGQ